MSTDQPGERTPEEARLAAIREKAQEGVVFVKRDGVWKILGAGLETGQTVTVTKRDGTTEQVLVGLAAPEDGLVLATFTRPAKPAEAEPAPAPGEVIFVNRDGEWLLKGRDFYTGEEVQVTKRSGEVVTKKIGAIVETVDGIDLAYPVRRCYGNPCECTDMQTWDDCMGPGWIYGRGEKRYRDGRTPRETVPFDPAVRELDRWGDQYA